MLSDKVLGALSQESRIRYHRALYMLEESYAMISVYEPVIKELQAILEAALESLVKDKEE